MIPSHRLIRLALLLSLAGCDSSGTNVTAEQAAQFVPGQTTTADVTAKLGQPDSVQTLTDGRTNYIYDHMQSTSNPMNYIPVVGMLAGGAQSKNNMVIFSFDPRGIYTGKSSNVSNTNTNFGFLNQH